MELPRDLIKQIEELESNTEQMLEEMTQAGAKVVEKNITANVPDSWKSSDIMKCLKVTKPYLTRDGAVNSKVAFYGYFENENGETIPAPLVVNVTEYGRSNSPYPRKPFLRKSFKKKPIEDAMLKIQKKYIKED